jgi:two-component system sensor histidine kinase KdpD
MTVISGASRVLRRHPAIVADQGLATVADDLANAARRMERVIGNMLLLASTEDARLKGEPVLVRLAVAEAIAALAREYPAASVRVIGSPDPSVSMDAVASWTQLILLNVLANAYLHGDRDREISIQWHLSDEMVHIDMCNGGETLPQETLDRWFEPFYRRRLRSTEPTGAGLGLTVARNLAQSQGGDLIARPWAPGPGTMTTLVVPVSS